jgi:hypothetical protein
MQCRAWLRDGAKFPYVPTIHPECIWSHHSCSSLYELFPLRIATLGKDRIYSIPLFLTSVKNYKSRFKCTPRGDIASEQFLYSALDGNKREIQNTPPHATSRNPRKADKVSA